MGPPFVGWPITFGDEWPVCDTDGRDTNDCAELESQAGSAWMVATSRVDEEQVRRLRQRANGCFQECALAECEQAPLIGRACIPLDGGASRVRRTRCPCRIADLARAVGAAEEGDEGGADPRLWLESRRPRA